MHIDLNRAWASVQSLVNAIIASLPNLLLAFIVFFLFTFLAKWAKWAVFRITDRTHHNRNLAILLGRLFKIIVLVIGVLVSLSIVLPTFKASDLIQVLGIGGVAIGFAFKDIFQNFLAGILILLNRPFRIGDQIVVTGYEGFVDDIQTRATIIRTFDNRRIVVPNTVLFTESVTVNTAFDKRRNEYEVGIGFDTDPDQATEIILAALSDIDLVEDDPKPDVVATKIGDYTMVLRMRWWIKSERSSLTVQDLVLREVLKRLTEAGVSLPYPTQIVMLQKDDNAAEQAS